MNDHRGPAPGAVVGAAPGAVAGAAPGAVVCAAQRSNHADAPQGASSSAPPQDPAAPRRRFLRPGYRSLLIFVAILLALSMDLLPSGQSQSDIAAARMSRIADRLRDHHARHGRWPDDIAVIKAQAPGDFQDPWGRQIAVVVESPRRIVLRCDGADGLPGGDGADRDLVHVVQIDPPADATD